MSLASSIKSIRSRIGRTMIEFAALIGCKQSTVSRYESGKLIPGRSVLLLLLQLAQGTEREIILDALGVNQSVALGWIERDFLNALWTFEDYLRATGAGCQKRDLTAEKNRIVLFSSATKEIILRGRPIEPALIAILNLWLAHADNPEAHIYFQHAASYLDVELTVLSSHPKKVRSKRASTGQK
jgi:transcriptional regulator with XRE-family HTH domain